MSSSNGRVVAACSIGRGEKLSQVTYMKKRKRKKQARPPAESFYYPLYNGYSFPEYPPLFMQPCHATAWAISRFMKDGLSNIWGDNKYPDFLNYVGIIKNRQGLVKRGNDLLLLQLVKSSQIEKIFFRSVIFYKVEDVNQLSKKECGYIRLKSEVFEKVMACFKLQPDYMSSSNSIYKNKELVISCHPPDQIQYQYNDYLYQKLASSKDGFIRTEDKLRYFSKENDISSEGK
jgi:hypothetical protein